MKTPLALLLLLAALMERTNAAPVAELTSLPSSSPAVDHRTYRLGPNDVVQVKVYQEDDLLTSMRLGKDGTATFPLLGTLNLGGKTVEEAGAHIKELLGKDYLVNPQVTINVVEYAKRRFTVLGQVQKPGTFEIPNEEVVTLLQAIAMAGGFTRLANEGKIVITRTLGGKKTIALDTKSASLDPASKPFEILPDDTITVRERVF